MHCDVRYADAVKVSAVVIRMNCTADEPALLVLEVTMHIGRLVATSTFDVPVDQHEAASHALVAHPMRYETAVVAPLPVTLVTIPVPKSVPVVEVASVSGDGGKWTRRHSQMSTDFKFTAA